MKKSLIFIQTVFSLFIYAGVSAQTFPVLPAPDNDVKHDATITGTITVNGSTQKIAGVLAKLSRVVPGSPATYVPVSFALSNASGVFSITGQAGENYILEYEYPTAGFTAPTGNPSASFAAVAGSQSAPAAGLELQRVPNAITSCNVLPTDITRWNKDLLVAKPVPTNSSSVLSSVTVFGSAAVFHPTIVATATTASEVKALTIGADVFSSGPGSYSQTVSSLKQFANVPAPQNINLAAGQSLTYYDISSGASSSKVLPSIATAYTGTGNVTFNLDASASKTITTTGGNTSSSEQTFAAGGVCLTYTYTTNPLPVTLSSFTAKAKVTENAKATALNWATTSETNSDKFDVERSVNTKEWASIGSVAASVTSGVEKKYSFDDVTPAGGVSYYRLKMIDKDATFAYSRIVKVQFEGNEDLVSLFPNPVSDELFVKDADSETIKQLTIFNAVGKPVYQTRSVSSDKGINVKNLSAGMYIVKISRNDGTFKTQKVIISR